VELPARSLSYLPQISSDSLAGTAIASNLAARTIGVTNATVTMGANLAATFTKLCQTSEQRNRLLGR
jgi:spore maturation protein SpmA